MNNLAESIGFTYSDYITWNDKIRWEIIDGTAEAMAAPSRRHQKTSGELFRQLANFLRGKRCEVYAAPFDVRLAADRLDNTVVQPDIVVVCDKSKLDGQGLRGAPDFIIEIISPSNIKRDTVKKRRRYEEAGVKEYWVIDPYNETVKVYILKGGVYGKGKIYAESDIIPVHTLPGCSIAMAEVFDYIESESELTENEGDTDIENDVNYKILTALKNKHTTKEQLIKFINENGDKI